MHCSLYPGLLLTLIFPLQLERLSARELAEELLQREYAALIAYEAARHPVREEKKKGKSASSAADVPPIEAVSWALCCAWAPGLEGAGRPAERGGGRDQCLLAGWGPCGRVAVPANASFHT